MGLSDKHTHIRTFTLRHEIWISTLFKAQAMTLICIAHTHSYEQTYTQMLTCARKRATACTHMHQLTHKHTDAQNVLRLYRIRRQEIHRCGSFEATGAKTDTQCYFLSRGINQSPLHPPVILFGNLDEDLHGKLMSISQPR